jgi:hypothetical protein
VNAKSFAAWLLACFAVSAPAAEPKPIGTHPTSPLTAFPGIYTLKAFENKIG